MPDRSPSRIFTLPLFPLHSVLFPHLSLHLHVFEDRYKAMINGCIERQAPFGVILIREGEEIGEPATPCEVGCVAQILQVERLSDGRMLLLAAGDRRFRLLEYMEADLPYLIGRVEELTEITEAPDDLSPLASQLCELFLRYLALLAERVEEEVPTFELPDDPVVLSFCVASVAMLSAEEKQRLLEMTDTCERLEMERDWLTEQIATLENLESDSPERQVLVARPIDLTSERWLNYLKSERN